MAKHAIRSVHARDIVYDPENPTEILAEFKAYKFETDDDAVAKKLYAMTDAGLGQYVPWAEVGPDDVFVLADGSEVLVSSLPDDVVRTLLSTPKRVKRVAKSITDKLTGQGSDVPPADKFVCEYPGCGKVFDSQAALNGHKASHSKRED